MRRHQSYPVNTIDTVYDEIKQRLTAALKNTPKYEKLTTFVSSNTTMPGPGAYSISNSTSPYLSPKSFKFLSSERFPKEDASLLTVPRHDSSARIHTEQISLNSPQPEYSAVENNLKRLQSASQGHSSMTSHNKSLSGSFSRAIRDTRFSQLENYDAGPASYDVKSHFMSQKGKTGFSIGLKLNTSSGSTEIPGPGTYRPEAVVINANHLSTQGPTILKTDYNVLEKKRILKRSPVGAAYYKTSPFNSSNIDHSRTTSLGYGQKLSFSLDTNKYIPGPGSYNLIVSPRIEEKTNPKTFEKYPTFGKPHSLSLWSQEYLPGPGDYDPVLESIPKHGTVKFGSSQRSGLAKVQKEPKIDITHPKFKKLLKVEALSIERLKSLKAKAKPSQEFSSFRNMIFDDIIEKAQETPGFKYDLSKYDQLGGSQRGAIIGKSQRRYLKEMEDEARSLPGPGEYDVRKYKEQKHYEKYQPQNKMATGTKRPDHFVQKESYYIPPVGQYAIRNKWGGQGGIITQAKREAAGESGYKKKKKTPKMDSYSDLMNNFESKLEKALLDTKASKTTEEDSTLI